MAVQIINNQIADSAIDGNKLATGAVSAEGKLANGVVAFAKIKSADIETDLAVSASSSKLADASAIKAYVDAQLPDNFAGGDGIVITDGAGTDTIAVDLATNSGLEFATGKLQLDLSDSSLFKDSEGVRVKLKAETGGSISTDAGGLYIADAAVSNAKLANSTISGVSLGSNLNSISAAADGAITFSSYNGSAAVSNVSVQVDGTTIAKASNALKIADGGVGSTQLADSSVSAAKVSFASQLDTFTGDGSATTFDLSNPVDSAFAVILVFRNGMALQQVQSAPSGVDQFTLSLTGGVGGNGRLTFGAAPSSSDGLTVFYIA